MIKFLKLKANKFLTKKGIKLSYKNVIWRVNDLADLFHGHRILREGIGYNKNIVSAWKIEHVLDLGCNKGYFPLWLKTLGKNFSYLGVDASVNMVGLCSYNLYLNISKFSLPVRSLVALIGPKNAIFQENEFHSPESKIQGVMQNLDSSIFGIKDVFELDVNRVPRKSLLKIDIEGAEYYLFSIKADLKYFNEYEYILIEYHKPFTDLIFLREKLENHQLVAMEEYENVGYAYFKFKNI